jgi:hypothetical protein
MISNIDKVLERGNQIDSLVVQTEELSNVSSDFRVKSKAVKNAMFWKNVKLILILLVIIVVRNYFIFNSPTRSSLLQLFGLFVDFHCFTIVENGSVFLIKLFLINIPR